MSQGCCTQLLYPRRVVHVVPELEVIELTKGQRDRERLVRWL